MPDRLEKKPLPRPLEPLTIAPGGTVGGIGSSPAAWARPLAPTLAELADHEFVRRHDELLARASKDAAEARALAGRVARQRSLDEVALRKAVAAGKKVPPAKAPELERELGELERRLGAYSPAALESARAVLGSIDERDVAEALAVTRARAFRELEALPAIVAELEAGIERVGAYGAEEAWLVALEDVRQMPPYGLAATATLSRALEDVRSVLPRIAEDLRDELERTEAWAAGEPAAEDEPRGFVTGGAYEVRDARTLTPEHRKAEAEGGEPAA